MVQVNMLNITEVGEATGLASSALRFYERNGLVESAGRAGGKRVYTTNRRAHRVIDIYSSRIHRAEICLLAADGPETCADGQGPSSRN